MGPGLTVLGLRIAVPKSEDFNLRVLDLRVSDPGSLVPGLRVPDLASQVLILDCVPYSLLSKFASQIRLIQSVVGSVASLSPQCQGLMSQGPRVPRLRVLGLMVQGFRISGLRVPVSLVSEFRVPGLRVPDLRS